MLTVYPRGCGSFGTAAVIHRIDATGKVEIAVLKKKGSDKPGKLLPMESQEPGENVETTLNLCLLSEVAKDAANFHWKLSKEWPIYVGFGDCQETPGAAHLKLFFLVTVEGELRDFEHPDAPDILMPMEWMEIESLLGHMNRVGTIPIHKLAVQTALVHLAEMEYAVYNRYSKLFQRFQKQELSDSESQIVRDLLRRKAA